jgi:Xaa-Pro aminopeptidase
MNMTHCNKTCLMLPLILVVLGVYLCVKSAFSQSSEPQDVYRTRRNAVASRLSDGVLVLFGRTEPEGSEAYHVFHEEENFYYLSGQDQPGAALMLIPAPRDGTANTGSPREVLFLPKRDPGEEQWTGPQPDPLNPATAAQTGFAEVKPIQELPELLRKVSTQYDAVYTLLPSVHAQSGGAEKDVLEKLHTLLPFASIRDARRTLGLLRQIKGDTEVKLIERAIDCTEKGIEAAEHELKPGLFEYEIGALLKYTFERSGCRGLAFDPIVGSGHNSTILHYTKNSARIADGDLTVIDVGAEYEHYAADITRTVPANGKFTARQREIYDIVLGAQKAAMQAVKPGMHLTGRGSDSLYQIAFNYINTHGKDSHGERLGKYFIHGLGHDVGLEVHDAGDFSRALEPGMVITLEPGIYLPDEHLGVRIEDMVLVTNDGYRLLTDKLPREPDEVEKMMRK